jgi:hypothetical protein
MLSTRKTTIPIEEWRQLENNARAAEALLTSKQFAFFIAFLESAKKEIESKILNNTIRDVSEEYTIQDQIKRIFFTPKTEQILELSGKYQMINQMLQFLHQVIDSKAEAEKLEKRGSLVIEHGGEDAS